MSNDSLPARGTDPPFSHKSVVSITHEQNIICSKTLIKFCRRLFEGHVVSSRPMKRKEKIHRMMKVIKCLFNKIPQEGKKRKLIPNLRNVRDTNPKPTAANKYFALR